MQQFKILLFFIFLALSSTIFAKESFEVLYSFNKSDGTGFESNYNLSLVGNKLYVTTEYGGKFEGGKLLVFDTKTNQLQELHHFVRNEIALPQGKLAFSKDKKSIFGIAYNDLYQMQNFAEKESLVVKKIHTFDTNHFGYHPIAAVILSPDEKYLYGITTNSGQYFRGTFYRLDLTKSEKSFELLHSFSGDIDGATPMTLVQSPDGLSLYGTTREGGNRNCGSVFEYSLQTPNARLQILANLKSCSWGYSNPSSLAISPDGQYLYGTQEASAFGDDEPGTHIYRLNLKENSAQIQIVYSFPKRRRHDHNWGKLGSPTSLVVSKDGKTLYGTAGYGGNKKDVGAIFKISIENDKFGEPVTLHEFDGDDGNRPLGLVFDEANNTLYGYTIWGGAHSQGVVFKYVVS